MVHFPKRALFPKSASDEIIQLQGERPSQGVELEPAVSSHGKALLPEIFQKAHPLLRNIGFKLVYMSNLHSLEKNSLNGHM